MPRYKVREKRAYIAEYLIDAVDSDAAGELKGEIVEESGGDGDDHGEELLSVELVADDAEL